MWLWAYWGNLMALKRKGASHDDGIIEVQGSNEVLRLQWLAGLTEAKRIRVLDPRIVSNQTSVLYQSAHKSSARKQPWVRNKTGCIRQAADQAVAANEKGDFGHALNSGGGHRSVMGRAGENDL
jgi:hypothetical protein